MKDITQGLGWYGLLAALPLVLAGLLVKERLAATVSQRARAHKR